MRFHSKPIEEHVEVPLADEGRLETLVAEWTGRQPGQGARAPNLLKTSRLRAFAGSRAPARPLDVGSTTPGRPAGTRNAAERANSLATPSDRCSGPRQNACYVVSVVAREDQHCAQARLREMVRLVEAQGDSVVAAKSQISSKHDARTLVGAGVAERLGREAAQVGADMLVLDAELTPSQMRNVEDLARLPICDREAVILNVFERHATTRRACIQVEIAHLEYLRPRIRGLGLNMDQQTGGLSKARGPGETASELLARQLDGRLTELRRRLVELKQAESGRRKQRASSSRVVLLGYTNAGKTSLMNAITAAGLSARDRPFETLDTTSRAISRHGGDVLLSDTVGFIRNLPERLFASFESTLAEISEASLLLLVVDSADPEAEQQLTTTEHMIARLGAAQLPRLYVFNKLDSLAQPLDPARVACLCREHPHVALSSRDPAAVTLLRERILALVRRDQVQGQLFVPYERGDVAGRVYAECRVLETTATETGTRLTIEAKPHILERLDAALRRRQP